MKNEKMKPLSDFITEHLGKSLAESLTNTRHKSVVEGNSAIHTAKPKVVPEGRDQIARFFNNFKRHLSGSFDQ